MPKNICAKDNVGLLEPPLGSFNFYLTNVLLVQKIILKSESKLVKNSLQYAEVGASLIVTSNISLGKRLSATV